MNNQISTSNSIEVRISLFADLAFIFYFSFYATSRVFGKFIDSSTVANMIAIMIPYAMVAVCVVLQPWKYIIHDFIVLYVAIILFFCATALIHPNYIPFYTREDFGVWDHVLNPYRGIYAYLFIRLIKEPKHVLKLMRIAGWIMIIYFLDELIKASINGYWMGQGRTGSVKMSYSVAFGYQALPFLLVYLHLALTEKKPMDIVSTAIYVVMVLAGGSRGPILFMAEYMLLYILIRVSRSRKAILYMVCVCLFFGIVYVFYDRLINFAVYFVGKLGFKSRFLESILNGNIADDNNRSDIWAAAIQMIRDKPWGYGAMGSRHVISSVIYAGYPHSIILELLIDYGIFIGGLMIVAMAVGSFVLLFKNNGNGWSEVFLPFFCSASCLLISMTYWSVPTFWACLAIAVNYHIAQKDPYQILYRFLGITQ